MGDRRARRKVVERPLVAPADELGARFPDLTEAWSRRLRDRLHEAARAEDVALDDGVYVGITGPNYETPAEVRMLRTLGADAVGGGEAGARSDAGGEGDAGIFEEVRDGSALDAGGGTPGAVGPGVAAVVAVIGGVGVEEDAGGAFLLGDGDLDAAEIFSVAAENDFAFYADAEVGGLF